MQEYVFLLNTDTQMGSRMFLMECCMCAKAVGVIRQSENFTFLWLVNLENVIFWSLESAIFQTLMQGKQIGIPVLVVNLNTIRMQLPLSCLFICKAQIFKGNHLIEYVANSFHCIKFACILGFFGLPLPKPFYLFYFLPLDFSNSFNPGWVVFVARFPICNYIFTSIAENRYSHSHS